MSERFMYMPSVGWAIIVAFGMMKILEFIKLEKKEAYVGGAVAVFLIPFLLLTVNRNKAWANDYILFTTDVKTSVESAKSNTSAGGKILEEVEKLEQLLRKKSISKKAIEKAVQQMDLREDEKTRILDGATSEEILANIRAFDKEYLEKSLYYLHRAIKIHPTYTDALLLLGNTYYRYNKNYDSTWFAYERIFKINPRHKLATKNWVLILNDSIPARKKIEYYERLLKYNPNHFESNYQIGNLYGRKLNMLDSSIVYLEKARAISPNQTKVYKDLGVAYGMSQQYEKALPVMLKAHQLDANDYQILVNIGVTYKLLGDIKKSNEYFLLAKQKQNIPKQ